MMFDCHEDFLKIEEAVLIQVNDYFAIIRRDVDSAWKENARERLQDSAKARQKAAEARLVKLQAHQGALKAEIMKSITGESTFDTDLLKEMMEENKQAQAATEQEILDCQNEVEDEEIRIAASATSYKNIQDWAAKFEGAPLDIKKMILARMIVDMHCKYGWAIYDDYERTHDTYSLDHYKPAK
jgi:hypothetical protein